MQKQCGICCTDGNSKCIWVKTWQLHTWVSANASWPHFLWNVPGSNTGFELRVSAGGGGGAEASVTPSPRRSSRLKLDCEEYAGPPVFISEVSDCVWEFRPIKSEGALYVEVDEPLLARVPLSSLSDVLSKRSLSFSWYLWAEITFSGASVPTAKFVRSSEYSNGPRCSLSVNM